MPLPSPQNNTFFLLDHRASNEKTRVLFLFIV